ncbi:glycoside hydrolase family 38 C-terminal domain-containing protein [Chitinophaga sp. MM2321]|uniref:glycoside hydrolase family 38 N-terminal domain-containing protein n=1 Tax=Chitinophaga sp. MM2321 TaxID=3137178 RepID=UPI0032D57741
MTQKLLKLLVCCCFPGMVSIAQQKHQPFTGVELQPTVAYLKNAGPPSRMVRLVFHGGLNYEAGTLHLAFNGKQDSLTIATNPEGIAYYEIPLPGEPVKEDTQLFIKYLANGQTYTARCMVSPTRKWDVYILPHSHVDIGYTNVQAKVLTIHMNNIDEAIKIARKSADYPAEARFKWNTEALWVVDHYLAAADEAKKTAFWEAVKKGWINLDGAYANTNTSATSSAQLLHLFETGVQLASDHGIGIHTMFQGDVPGASWGLSAQADITGIRYFLSAPNASDRIGTSYEWRDKPFYWQSPSGGQRLLFWQCSPYSIGYMLKGSKIPNFFTVEDPKPYYTGKPSENFLNPFLFDYLSKLEQQNFPYNMTLLTWAMSDNAPLDPELPDAVKAWNERYASPRLIITAVPQFFHDFESAYKDKIPVMSGDYTEYWTDGIASGARETAINRNASDRLQQAGAIWALRGKQNYPVTAFNQAWTNLILFNEHTWGAHNSVSHPEDPKAISQWKYKQAFALNAQLQAQTLLDSSTAGALTRTGEIDVYNTLAKQRTGLVTVPANMSSNGDLVKDNNGKKVPSQRLSTGELVFLATALPPFSKQRFTIYPGAAYVSKRATIKGNSLQNGIYSIEVDGQTGNIIKLQKSGSPQNFADSAGLNQYNYLPGDSVEKLQHAGKATITIKEKGPLVVSLLIATPAPGANYLNREIKLVAGTDQVELINTIDKKAVATKESVHFVFPFHIPGGQVRYSIPWGSITAEADQIAHANRNWYTMQRWVDVSNKEVGVTWSSPDAPLFEIGQYPTAGLIGGLHNFPGWIGYTEQQPVISSWVMNNLWHTNFRREQEGITTFHYYLQVHNAYDATAANWYGLENHQPLVVAPATGAATASLFFNIAGKDVYVENIYPASNGKGVLLQLVNAAETPTQVTLSPKNKTAVLQVWQSNLLEEYKGTPGTTFTIPAKGVIMIRVETK